MANFVAIATAKQATQHTTQQKTKSNSKSNKQTASRGKSVLPASHILRHIEFFTFAILWKHFVLVALLHVAGNYALHVACCSSSSLAIDLASNQQAYFAFNPVPVFPNGFAVFWGRATIRRFARIASCHLHLPHCHMAMICLNGFHFVSFCTFFGHQLWRQVAVYFIGFCTQAGTMGLKAADLLTRHLIRVKLMGCVPRKREAIDSGFSCLNIFYIYLPFRMTINQHTDPYLLTYLLNS